jgi:hypothetical protein
MRTSSALVLLLVVFGGVLAAQTAQTPGAAPAAPEAKPPVPTPIGTMSELMLKVLYPYSDAFFYVERAVPKDDVEWGELQGKGLAIAELGNVLMMPGRARDQDQWLKDAKLLAEAGAAVFRAAEAKDLNAILARNDQLVDSCTSCHMHYRPNYGRRRLLQQQPPAQPTPAAPPPQ